MSQRCDVPMVWLETFVIAAETGSRSAAGAALGISQSQASRNVKNLGAWLGRLLFVSEGSSVLSPDGEEFLETAREVIRLLLDSRMTPDSAPLPKATKASGRDVTVP